jgi:hypothetical protein
MPCVGFQPTITASERAKTVHALDRSATVTGQIQYYKMISVTNVSDVKCFCGANSMIYNASLLLN